MDFDLFKRGTSSMLLDLISDESSNALLGESYISSDSSPALLGDLLFELNLYSKLRGEKCL
jgi:hypothetical protein